MPSVSESESEFPSAVLQFVLALSYISPNMSQTPLASDPIMDVDSNQAEGQCWICLGDGLKTPLISPCACPRMVHRTCLARWQIHSLGKAEEHSCRFCSQELPDWRKELLKSYLNRDYAIISVNHKGTRYRLKVRPGEQGYIQFQQHLQQISGSTSINDTQLSFNCLDPRTSTNRAFQGVEAFNMVLYSASISMARRARLLNSLVGGTGEEVPQEAICLGDGLKTPLISPCACPRMVHRTCLARWQIHSLGKAEEHSCRFCSQELPDWRKELLKSYLNRDYAIISVNHKGTRYRLKVRPGEQGYIQFQQHLQQISGSTSINDTQLSFNCLDPRTSTNRAFQGVEAFNMVLYSASISMARRARLLNSLVGGTGEEVPQEAICLGDGLKTPLISPCACPRMVHRTCLARWQIHSLGKAEEHSCRFCSQELPDWRKELLKSYLNRDYAIISVNHKGTRYRLKVRPGEQGYIQFQQHLQQISGSTSINDTQLSFNCLDPRTSTNRAFQGVEAFNMVLYSASISMARRARLLNSLVGGTGEEVPQEAICLGDGLKTPLISPCACPRMVHRTCLARWQIHSLGKAEEHSCRFCSQELPDWRKELLKSYLNRDYAIISVNHKGTRYRLKVRPGEQGYIQFPAASAADFWIHLDQRYPALFQLPGS
eukprot:gene7374-498_t